MNSIVPKAAEEKIIFKIEFFSTAGNCVCAARKEFSCGEIFGDSRFAVKTEVLGEELR
jgi:hypothetical protein